ncbi:MAG: zinc ABC transporter substrate-binding protein [Rhodospirillaceae bacterium]|nr:zinc ABC transporter substrate-binding protein [Rhodospirillaceae bacterium]
MLRITPLLAALAFLAGTSGAAAQEKLSVVATFSILGDLARQIGGEAIDLRVLVGPEQDAHGYDPRPEDQKSVAAAEVLIANGLGFESWLERLSESAGFAGRLVIATEGITALPWREEHGDEHSGEEHAGEAHAGEDHDSEHDHGSFDPHAFQDAQLVLTYVDNIASGLAAARPDLAEKFHHNANELKQSFAALDAELKTALGALPANQRRVLTSHDAFSYFGRAYGIAFVGIQSAGMDDEPTAQDLRDVIEAIENQQIRAVFLENMTDPRFVETLARDTGIRIGGTLYADALSGPDGPAPDLLSLFRHNQRELLKALQ